nr:sterol desaturase family protein [Marinigracilibium pacificum]
MVYSKPLFIVLIYSIVYFIALYFVLAPLFLTLCKRLEKLSVIEKISDRKVTKSQIRYEIKNSCISILIFAFSGIPIISLIRSGQIATQTDTLQNIIIGILVLTTWNEIHFFIVHRIMHIPFFLKWAHKIHHRSVTPTVFSVYSFHWFEALLLSTVQLTIIWAIPLSVISISIFPLVSILLNLAGHCNYRIKWKGAPRIFRFGTTHNKHHNNASKEYGFALYWIDYFNQKIFRKSHKHE